MTHSLDDIPMPKPQSMSPDILEMLAKDEEDEDVEPPILLNVPQLPGPLAFSEEALNTWGHAHIDNSEQSIHFHTQLREWKHTMSELRVVLAKAYEETHLLTQYVISNEVSKDHIHTLHMQIKRTAFKVFEASQDVDNLITIALKQMILNVAAVWDFGMVLCAIPFNTLSIHNFYHSI